MSLVLRARRGFDLTTCLLRLHGRRSGRRGFLGKSEFDRGADDVGWAGGQGRCPAPMPAPVVGRGPRSKSDGLNSGSDRSALHVDNARSRRPRFPLDRSYDL